MTIKSISEATFVTEEDIIDTLSRAKILKQLKN